jgi:penicillin-binding protein 1A
MQVARNFYLPTEKTFTRKIYEILLAMKIESKLSKDQILELYMNQIFLGQRAYGFAAACDIISASPSRTSRWRRQRCWLVCQRLLRRTTRFAIPSRATIRQQHIIDRMYENRFITAEQRDEAKADELHYRTKAPIPHPTPSTSPKPHAA